MHFGDKRLTLHKNLYICYKYNLKKKNKKILKNSKPLKLLLIV